MKSILRLFRLLCVILSALCACIFILKPSDKTVQMTIQEGYLKPAVSYSITPTPFQPMEIEKKTPTLTMPMEINKDLPTDAMVSDSNKNVPDNPYELNGIDFGIQDTVSIVFSPVSGNEIQLSFQPVIATDPDLYRPGIGKAGTFADENGNITINPHSGCFKYSTNYVPLEAEYLRRFLEGGDCIDILSHLSEDEILSSIEELKTGSAYMQQNETKATLQVIGAGVIPFDRLNEVNSMSPTELSSLIGLTLNQRSVVIVTSGWDIFHDPWFSAERWIIVLEGE